jgi:hypothetical protein
MAKLLVLYKKPKALKVWISITCRSIFQLRTVRHKRRCGRSASPMYTPSLHRFTTLSRLGAAPRKSRGRDLVNLADGGAEFYLFDAKEV